MYLLPSSNKRLDRSDMHSIMTWHGVASRAFHRRAHPLADSSFPRRRRGCSEDKDRF
ncbi:hypothetical protein C8Q77DRAFT_1147193 [Trametes polyzona]|nr:hypothetical protein C8Q77DRAFT_1147193 [Trametes polyzona]